MKPRPLIDRFLDKVEVPRHKSGWRKGQWTSN